VEDDKEYCTKMIDKRRLAYMGGPNQWSKMKQLLQNEINVLKRLEHPNIVQLFHIEQTANLLYIVMEYMPGGELFDYIINRGVLTESEAARIALQVASAVAYCHSFGVAHRDLKPENLLLGEVGNLQCVKIADFGFAKAIHNSTTKSSLGTPGYVAPEITEGKPHTKVVDVWSMGVIFYVLMQGCLPFEPVEVGEWQQEGHSAGGDCMDSHPGYTLDFVTDGDWTNISTSAKELLWQMLQYDYAQRISAAEVMQHPWVLGHSASDAALPSLNSPSASSSTRSRRTSVYNMANAAGSVLAPAGGNATQELTPELARRVDEAMREMVPVDEAWGGGIDCVGRQLVYGPEAATAAGATSGGGGGGVSSELVMPGVRAQWAYTSRRGFDQENPGAVNQDTLAVAPTFFRQAKAGEGAECSAALLMICDGHGTTGHACARFAREGVQASLHKQLEKECAGWLQAEPGASTPGGWEKWLNKACLETQQQMSACDALDSSNSGSGVLVCMLCSGFNAGAASTLSLQVAHLGESRVLVAFKQQGGTSGAIGGQKDIMFHQLSHDHTPYRKDERDRICNSGGRILTVEQLNGKAKNGDFTFEATGDLDVVPDGEGDDEGHDSSDPPRVWHASHPWPGALFTRSIGDTMAKEIGVVATPELCEHVFTGEEQFVLLGSDGLFTFMTNKQVVDVCAQSLTTSVATSSSSSNPALEACKTVVAQAYALWLVYDVCTDHITVVVLCFDQLDCSIVAPSATGGAALTMPGVVQSESQRANSPMSKTDSWRENRPVRTQPSAKMRRQLLLKSKSWKYGEEGVEDGVDEEDEASAKGYVVEEHLVAKTEEEMAAIGTSVAANFLFRNLSQAQRLDAIRVMKRVEVGAGKAVIKQGDEGDLFYVVSSGDYDVRLLNQDAPAAKDAGYGDVVHSYEGTGSFGELALMYAKPRAASVVARTDGMLWALDRQAFRYILMGNSTQAVVKALRRVPVLKQLPVASLRTLAGAMEERSYEKGEKIIAQGSPCSELFLVSAGSVQCTAGNADGTDDTEAPAKPKAKRRFSLTGAISRGLKRTNSGRKDGKELAVLHRGSYFGLFSQPLQGGAAAEGGGSGGEYMSEVAVMSMPDRATRCLVLSKETIERLLECPLNELAEHQAEAKKKRAEVLAQQNLQRREFLEKRQLTSKTRADVPSDSPTLRAKATFAEPSGGGEAGGLDLDDLDLGFNAIAASAGGGSSGGGSSSAPKTSEWGGLALPIPSPLLIPVSGSDDFTACELKSLRPLIGVTDQAESSGGSALALYSVVEASLQGGTKMGRFGLKSLRKQVVEEVSSLDLSLLDLSNVLNGLCLSHSPPSPHFSVFRLFLFLSPLPSCRRARLIM
jgi:CRP-like cAMP-binding protein/serine/threonine protein phosphatase PrpC